MSAEWDKEMEERRKAAQTQQQIEQGQAFIRDFLPSWWKGMFDNLMKEGFREDQALALVQTYILAVHNTSGVNGTGT